MTSEDDFVVKEGKTDKPIGLSPNPLVKQALEKLYISIVGALDIGDFTTFLKESADLTYDETKDKMVREYGTQKELSEAKMKAKSAEAEAQIAQAEREVRAEQRTLEEEFAEIEEVAHRTLEDNLALFRRNEELEKEVKRLKEELAKKPTPPTALPEVPAPVPPVPAVPPAHGSMYDEFRRRINESVTLADLDEIAADVYDIAQHEEYDKLTRSDVSELIALTRTTYERRSARLAEMRLPEQRKKPVKKPGEKPSEEEIRIRREEGEAPAFFGISPPHVMHRYQRPDTEMVVFKDVPFVRDYELERTILRNSLLLFPPQWFALPPEEKVTRFGWDLATAMRHAVEFLHKFSWEDLIKDYGIPEKYVEAWKKATSQ